jgi:hypothetical protein
MRTLAEIIWIIITIGITILVIKMEIWIPKFCNFMDKIFDKSSVDDNEVTHGVFFGENIKRVKNLFKKN